MFNYSAALSFPSSDLSEACTCTCMYKHSIYKLCTCTCICTTIQHTDTNPHTRICHVYVHVHIHVHVHVHLYNAYRYPHTSTQYTALKRTCVCACTLLYLSQGVYCKYRFYLDNEDCKTNSVSSTTNPNFNYSKHFSVNPVTQQFLEYLTLQPLIVEVWGQQVETQGSNKAAAATHLLTTRELMNKESAKFGSMVILNPDPQKVSYM